MRSDQAVALEMQDLKYCKWIIMEKKCSQCDKVFWRKDALIRHEKSVHSKVKCVNCGDILSSYHKDVHCRWSVTSTTTSSIKVKILIWSTWFFSTNGHLLCILLTSAFAKLKLFFLHFYEAFFTAIRDQNSHFRHNINH